MDFEIAEEHRMLKDLVANFVRDELMPLEAGVLAREAEGKGLGIGPDEHARLDKVARELGLFGLDAPEDVGGADLPHVAMVAVNEELGRNITNYTLPPDSPNLRMMMATVNEQQRAAYLAPYVARETISAIGISEPGAGADPSGMTTSAVRDGDDWIIHGRKIWISRAAGRLAGQDAGLQRDQVVVDEAAHQVLEHAVVFVEVEVHGASLSFGTV